MILKTTLNIIISLLFLWVFFHHVLFSSFIGRLSTYIHLIQYTPFSYMSRYSNELHVTEACLKRS